MTVVPFPRSQPTACAVVCAIAEAMRYRGPEEARRVRAEHHPTEIEIDALVALYKGLRSRNTRQAILDAMVSATTIAREPNKT